MNKNKWTKAELLQYIEELEKVAAHNKEACSRALLVAESYHAVCEKEGLIQSDAITLSEH